MKNLTEIMWAQALEAHEYVYGGEAMRRLADLESRIRQLTLAQKSGARGAGLPDVPEGATKDELAKLYWACQKELMKEVNVCLELLRDKVLFIARVKSGLKSFDGAELDLSVLDAPRNSASGESPKLDVPSERDEKPRGIDLKLSGLN